MTKRFNTLPALPGSSDDGVQAIVKVLDFVANTKEPTKEMLLSWLSQEYEIKPKTAINALQGIKRSSLILIRSNGVISLTDLGKRVLQMGAADCHHSLAPHFIAKYNGLVEILNVMAKSTDSLTQGEIAEGTRLRFTRWTLNDSIHWLVALQCMDYAESAGAFKITAFGKTLVAETAENVQSALGVSQQGRSKPLLSLHQERRDLAGELIRELEAACVASADYARFEKVLVRIFAFLGYVATRISGSGNTDVLVKALLGPASYSIAVDAKSHLSFRRADVEADNLAYHMRHHKATYAVAVAKKFVQGRRLEEAKAQQVLFMTTDCLITWIHLHAEIPLSPIAYEIIFQHTGLMTQLPIEITDRAKNLKQSIALMAEVFAIFVEAHRVRLSMNIPIDHLLKTANERHADVLYQMDDLRTIISFLKSPFLSYLGEDKDGGLYLERSPEELPIVLGALLGELGALPIAEIG